MPVGCEASLERFAAIRGADRGLGDGGGRDAIRTWNPGLSLRNASYATFRDRQKRRNSKLFGPSPRERRCERADLARQATFRPPERPISASTGRMIAGSPCVQNRLS